MPLVYAYTTCLEGCPHEESYNLLQVNGNMDIWQEFGENSTHHFLHYIDVLTSVPLFFNWKFEIFVKRRLEYKNYSLNKIKQNNPLPD